MDAVSYTSIPVAATIVDTVGTAALTSVSDLLGVSLSINTHYINPMPGGEDVAIEACVVKAGKQIATIEVTLRRQSTGALVAKGTHVKALVPHSRINWGSLVAASDHDATPISKL